MKKNWIYITLFSFVFLLTACSKDDPPGTIGQTPGNTDCEDSAEWTISSCAVFDGGPGKDGIPSVDAPNFILASDVDYLEDTDLVVGVFSDGALKAYPHPIMDWHEIVNDKIGNTSMAITYCPLTGTAIGWDRMIDGALTSFGVSGLLYNTNLIPYDRKTDSNWSQIGLESVNGTQAGNRITTHHLIETEWETWKTMFPNSLVMTEDTGFDRNYGTYPYGDYRTNHRFLIFPVSNEDERLERKERGLGILINGRAKFYNRGSFRDAPITVVPDNFLGTELVVIGSWDKNIVVAYERTLEDGTALTFTAIEDESNDSSAVMIDNEGNKWNILGVAVEGPREGSRLTAPESFIGYWFAWATFYPDLELYE